MKRFRKNLARTQKGFSHTEVLIATFLITIALVPALEAMQTGISGSGIHLGLARNNQRLTDKMEDLLVQPYGELATEAAAAGGSNVIVNAYSDAAGTESRRLVYLAHYDGHTGTFSGSDTGLLWLRVAIEGGHQSMHTLLNR